MATCDVTPVRSSGELREFRRLPRLLRGADSHWVEPLRAEQAWLLNRAHHPFYVDGEGVSDRSDPDRTCCRSHVARKMGVSPPQAGNSASTGSPKTTARVC